MKYELPSTELIVIEENNYLKFGEYLNDMQCDDTANKLSLDDLEYVKKLQQENKQLKDNWNKLKEYFNERIEVCDNRLSSPFCNFEKATKERLIFSQCLEKLEELEESDSNVKD